MGNTKSKKDLIKWNRKIHMYLGLCLLFFIMLIGFSGLLLNHHWEFTNFWESRKEISYNKSIQISNEREPYALIHEIMNKLNLKGNVNNLKFSSDSMQVNFNISKPGTHNNIQANLHDGNILIKEIKFNKWGTIRNLHTIRNPTLKEQRSQYPTNIASVWSISIDIVSVGLILICLGGWYLWLKVPKKRFYLGLVSIISGSVICAYFLLF